MSWISNNWIWIVFAVGMIAMHLFGHRGHSHGSKASDAQDPVAPDETRPPGGHDHGSVPQRGLASVNGPRSADPANTPRHDHRHGC